MIFLCRFVALFLFLLLLFAFCWFCLLICGSFNDEASILDFRITNKIHDSVNMNNSNELTNDKKTWAASNLEMLSESLGPFLA